MKHGGLIKKFGRSILSKIPHKKDRGKANQQLQTALPLIYAGTWLFIDDLSQKHHKLEITHLDESSLVFLDTYGYHLQISAENLHPVSVYDEADNRSYALSEYYK